LPAGEEENYDDALAIGLKIISVGLDRDRHADGHLIQPVLETAQSIMREHGATCDTYKLADEYLQRYRDESQRWYKWAQEEDPDYYNDIRYFDETDEYETLRDDFTKALLEEYSVLLQREYEYFTSGEVVAETLEANDYDFTEDGRID